jgi:hypothetical protein
MAAALLVLALLAAVLAWLMQPPRAVGFLLDTAGRGLGLEIRAGRADYRLRGTPQLVLREVVAQRPGETVPLLRADRVFVSLPWSTIRARGNDLTVQRLELDAPELDLPALQRWLDTRPPSETRIPTLRDGLRIRRGRVDNRDWRLEGVDVVLPSLSPSAPVDARVRGRYLDPSTQVPFDLGIALTRPANDAGLAIVGGLAVEGEGWRLPARVRLSGPLHAVGAALRISPARIGISARYVSTDSDLPFVLGAHGPLLFDKAVWSLDPATLVLRGSGPIPDATARGALALGRRLVLRVAGEIAAWPPAWPALPPPLSASASPLPFALDYAGRADASEVASLQVRREDTTLDARFRLPAVLAWLDAGATGSPLPPLQGTLRTPRVEMAGTQLEGVEIEFDDPGSKPVRASP